ncbi:hypothetical protein ACJX0J_040758, partial [Zea mays]
CYQHINDDEGCVGPDACEYYMASHLHYLENLRYLNNFGLFVLEIWENIALGTTSLIATRCTREIRNTLRHVDA